MAGRIVVAVDGSEHSRAALLFAVEEARLRAAMLVAVHAWTYVPPPPLGSPDLLAVPVGDIAGELELVRAAAERIFEEELADVPAGVEVERRLVEGDPGEGIIEESADADLVVIGSRGHGGLKTVFLGSVSNHVIQHATCPVVVVRA
jgi:nucleotide-binding universal stress UspA family protein